MLSLLSACGWSWSVLVPLWLVLLLVCFPVSLGVCTSVCLLVRLLCWSAVDRSSSGASLLGRSRGGRVVCLSLGLGARPWVVVVVPLESAMSRFAVRLASHHSSFGGGIRFLSHLAVGGELSLSTCSYGTGLAYVEFDLPPAVAAVWPAIASLAFSDNEGYDGDTFVGDWCVGKDNSRPAALDALLAAVRA
jgi:hypothetical protein